MKIKVSVIIPNYNRTNKLKLAINSVLNQSFQDFEILVVDDFSEKIEEIKVLIEDFNDNRIKFIEHSINRGGGAARNTGILKAKGKYIAFLDSDDAWAKNKIEKQFLACEKYGNEVFCYTQTKVYTNNWTKILPNRGKYGDESVSKYLFQNNKFIPTPSMFISSTLAKKCLFNEKLRRHQDYDFLFKVEKLKPSFIFLNEPLTIVNWRDGKNLKKKKWSSKLSYDFFESYREHMDEKSYYNAIFNSVIYLSAKYESKIKSIKYLYKMPFLIFHLKFSLILKYIIRLLLIPVSN
jgi:glycosyltransferase involved in cell wall biosynthesis